MMFRSRKVIQRQNVRPQGGRRELPLNGTKYTSWTSGKLDGAQKHRWYINNNIPAHIWPQHAMRSPPARTCTLPHHEQSRHVPVAAHHDEYAVRGSRSGRDCHAVYQEPLCVGLAKADMVKKRNARGKGKEFSKPTVSQIKRYARKKQRDLEGDE